MIADAIVINHLLSITCGLLVLAWSLMFLALTVNLRTVDNGKYSTLFISFGVSIFGNKIIVLLSVASYTS